jgi:hypothetical protein
VNPNTVPTNRKSPSPVSRPPQQGANLVPASNLYSLFAFWEFVMKNVLLVKLGQLLVLMTNWVVVNTLSNIFFLSTNMLCDTSRAFLYNLGLVHQVPFESKVFYEV